VSEEDENKAVVRRWIETFNNPYTPQTEVDVLAPVYVAHAPWLPGPLDLEAWSQFAAAFVEAFPDLRLTVEDIFSGGNMVAARVAFRGTHRGEFQGIRRQARKWPSRASKSTAWWTARWPNTGLRWTCSV
jgi:predicted ester cyclase